MKMRPEEQLGFPFQQLLRNDSDKLRSHALAPSVRQDGKASKPPFKPLCHEALGDIRWHEPKHP
jgi:hypothetical protein